MAWFIQNCKKIRPNFAAVLYNFVQYGTIQYRLPPTHPTHTQKWFFFFAFPGHFQNFPKTFRKKPKTSKKKFGFLGFFWRLPLWVNDQISAQISLELDSLELHSCLNNNLNAPPPPQQLTCCQQAKWIRSHMTSPSQLKVSPSQSRHPLLSPGIPLPQCFYQDIPVPSQTSPSHDNFQLRQGYPKSEGDTRGYLYMCWLVEGFN